ncbi:hypothetical protein AKJ16_DCAP06878 [Drosera capensis]
MVKQLRGGDSRDDSDNRLKNGKLLSSAAASSATNLRMSFLIGMLDILICETQLDKYQEQGQPLEPYLESIVENTVCGSSSV